MILNFCNNKLKIFKFFKQLSVYILVIRFNGVCITMYEDILRQQVIVEIKNLIKKAEDIEEDKDLYCDFMKTVILNTYSCN